MAFGGEVAVGVLTNALWDVLKVVVGRVRARGGGWVDAVSNRLVERGVDLSHDERRRLGDWLATVDLDALAGVDDGPAAWLAHELDVVVLGTGEPRFATSHADPTSAAAVNAERAERLAGVLWPSLVDALPPEERRRVRAEVAAIRTSELAAVALDHVGLLAEMGEAADATLQRLVEAVDGLGVRMAPGIPLERPRLRPPPGPLSPYQLLWARFGVAPFEDRAGWLPALEEWCYRSDTVAVQIVTGAGGMGKTRLALELCRSLNRQGWIAGLLKTAAPGAASVVDPDELRRLATEPSPRLVVIDYADLRPGVVEAVLEALSDPPPLRPHRVRLLLLVRRPHDVGDPRRFFARGRQDHVAYQLSRADVLAVSTTGAEGSSAVRFEREEREALFRRAVQRFAERLGGQPGDPPADLDSGTYRSPLMVVVASALAAEPGFDRLDVGASRGDVLDRVLEREAARHWHDSPEPDAALTERAVAVATLLGADSDDEAQAHLAIVPGFAGDELHRQRVANWLASLYDGPRRVNPLEPDVLGEHLVARHLDGALVLYALGVTEPTATLRRGLAVLGRVAAGYPDGTPIIEAVEQTLPNLVSRALEEERMAGDAGRDLVADALASLVSTLPYSWATALGLPRPLGNAGARLAALLAERTVGQLRIAASAAGAGDETSRGALAGWLNDLSIRLVDVGRSDDALSAVEEAVAMTRRLVESNRTTWHQQLARCLNTESNILTLLGRVDDAVDAIQEAVAIRRRLAAADPAAIPPLIGSLNNLANRLADTGHDSEALAVMEEVVAAYRVLANGTSAWHPALAGSLNNFANRLAGVGRDDERLEAIREAVGIHRALVSGNPAAWSADLAMSLSTLAGVLRDLGSHHEAISSIEEAVAIRRRLAAGNPAAWDDTLAGCLGNLARCLEDVGRHAEGLAAIEEAVDLRSQPATVNTAAGRQTLQRLLPTYARLLTAVGRADDAVAALDTLRALERGGAA